MPKISGKKILLSFHIIFIAIWFGSLTSILLLRMSKQFFADASNLFVVDRLIFSIFNSVIMNVSIAVTVSGLLFSIFTNWSFLKFRWIIVKWIVIFLLAVIIVFFARPSINGLAGTSDVFRQECVSNSDYAGFERNVVFYCLIQLAILIFLILISVLKPWSIRKQRFKVNRKIIVSTSIILGALLAIISFIQSKQLKQFRDLSVTDVNLEQIEDGTYFTKVRYGFEYEVKVDIKNHSIENIEFLKNRDSFYARLAEGIRHKIIHEQKINIDVVTGATTTSKILIKAVETAITSSKQ